MQKEKQRKNNEKVVGVITLLKVLPNSFEILFLAVNPDHHRRETGRKRINYVEEAIKNEGAKWLFVKHWQHHIPILIMPLPENLIIHSLFPGY